MSWGHVADKRWPPGRKKEVLPWGAWLRTPHRSCCHSHPSTSWAHLGEDGVGWGGDASFAHFVTLNISFNSLSLSFQLWQRRNAPDEGGAGDLRVSSRHSAMLFWSGRGAPGAGEHVSFVP